LKSTKKGKAKPRDVRVVKITGCHQCPHVTAINDRTFICEAARPKFVVSENARGNPPERIPPTCPLPKEADRDG